MVCLFMQGLGLKASLIMKAVDRIKPVGNEINRVVLFVGGGLM